MVKIEKHPPYIEVARLGSGWAAVMMSWDDGHYDVWQTGVSRHETRALAEREARYWAKSEEIQFRE